MEPSTREIALRLVAAHGAGEKTFKAEAARLTLGPAKGGEVIVELAQLLSHCVDALALAAGGTRQDTIRALENVLDEAQGLGQ